MISEDRKSNILADLANSWPASGRYLPEKDIKDLIECSSGVVKENEAEFGGGARIEMMTKLKIHAEHYGLQYSPPSEYQKTCEIRKRKMCKKWWQFWV